MKENHRDWYLSLGVLNLGYAPQERLPIGSRAAVIRTDVPTHDICHPHGVEIHAGIQLTFVDFPTLEDNQVLPPFRHSIDFAHELAMSRRSERVRRLVVVFPSSVLIGRLAIQLEVVKHDDYL